jgi:hypothetical protein
MAPIWLGPQKIVLDRDEEGHRTYTVTSKVRCTPSDGALAILGASGLPQVGDYFDLDGVDLWAFCYPNAKVEDYNQKDGEKSPIKLVTQTFGTKPLKRCQDTDIENPLLEPPDLSGSFVKFTREVYQDRFGRYIKSSSHELIRGPQVEFEQSKMSVKVKINLIDLDLELVASMIDCTNASVLWGLGPRKVRFANHSWERKLYGTCTHYYTHDMEFDIDWNASWDRFVLDEGTRVLNGDWDRNTGAYVVKKVTSSGTLPNPDNPQHFVRYKDRNGENTRVILNGSGLPANSLLISGTGTGTTVSGGPAQIRIEHYGERDLLLLGIPSSLV